MHAPLRVCGAIMRIWCYTILISPIFAREPARATIIYNISHLITMADMPPRQVFVSLHRKDRRYKYKFVNVLDGGIVDRSVGDGDIDKNLKVSEIRRQIRDDFISDAAVTVILVGCCTWQRKYVDWEIGASLIDTAKNDRCGLLGILLPTHPDYGKQGYNPRLLPPRLARNLDGKQPFANLYDWTDDKAELTEWIEYAFQRRNRAPPPDNNYVPFAKNRTTKCSKGWQS